MRTILIAAIISSLTGIRAACAQGADSLQARAETLISGGPREWYGHSAAAIVSTFGRPARMDSRAAYPDHPGSLDSLFTFHYDGATFVFYNDMLIEATLWRSRFLKRSPIALGASVADVRSYFGDPSHGSTPHMFYSTTGGLVDHLELWFEKDHLVRLKWIYGAD